MFGKKFEQVSISSIYGFVETLYVVIFFESHLITAAGKIMICLFALQVPDDSGLIQLDVRAQK